MHLQKSPRGAAWWHFSKVSWLQLTSEKFGKRAAKWMPCSLWERFLKKSAS